MDPSVTAGLRQLAPDAADLVEILRSGTTPATANVAALVSTGLIGNCVGAAVSFTKTSTGTNTVLPASTGSNRFVVLLVQTDEAIADAGGTAPVFTLGEESGSATKFAAAASLGAMLGNVRIFSGTLTRGKKLECYATAAVTTGTGGITVTVIAVKAAS